MYILNVYNSFKFTMRNYFLSVQQWGLMDWKVSSTRCLTTMFAYLERCGAVATQCCTASLAFTGNY